MLKHGLNSMFRTVGAFPLQEITNMFDKASPSVGYNSHVHDGFPSALESMESTYQRDIRYIESPHRSQYVLVGGWATPLENMKVNWDD